ncbi:hypothetical protein H1R20_g12537, partial [Candolleomyces eurysporus]
MLSLTASSITLVGAILPSPPSTAAEFYEGSTEANPKHISKLGELVEGSKGAQAEGLRSG